jgi:hypothetical protein
MTDRARLPGGAAEIAARLQRDADRDRAANEHFQRRLNRGFRPTPHPPRETVTTEHAAELAEVALESSITAYLRRKVETVQRVAVAERDAIAEQERKRVRIPYPELLGAVYQDDESDSAEEIAT